MNSDQLLKLFEEVFEEIQRSVGVAEGLASDSGASNLIESIINALDQLGVAVEEVIPREVIASYLAGVKEAGSLLNQAGVSVPNGTRDLTVTMRRRIHLEAVEQVLSETMDDLRDAMNNARTSVRFNVNNAVQSFREDLAKGLIQGDHNRVVAQRVAENFKERGIVGFTTVDGKNLPVDFYAKTVTQTKIKHANVQGAVNRYVDNDQDLVTTNVHFPTCDSCAKKQGLVISLTGRTEGFPLAGRDIELPPWHPNCFHSVRPYVIEYKTDAEIQAEKEKWRKYQPDKDPRTAAQKKSYERQQEARRKANVEKKAYAEMVMYLGGDAPKTLGAYRRMKRSNSANFQEKRAQMKQIKRDAKAATV